MEPMNPSATHNFRSRIRYLAIMLLGSMLIGTSVVLVKSALFWSRLDACIKGNPKGYTVGYNTVLGPLANSTLSAAVKMPSLFTKSAPLRCFGGAFAEYDTVHLVNSQPEHINAASRLISLNTLIVTAPRSIVGVNWGAISALRLNGLTFQSTGIEDAEWILATSSMIHKSIVVAGEDRLTIKSLQRLGDAKGLDHVLLYQIPSLSKKDWELLVGRLPLLKRFSIGSPIITNDVLAAIAKQTRLEILTLLPSRFTPGVLKYLSANHSLVELNVVMSNTNDADWSELIKFSKLRRLNLDGVFSTSDREMIRHTLPNVEITLNGTKL